MTPTNYRALCSTAIELWEADCDMESVISDMRTALAQPEPVAPEPVVLPPSGWAYRYPTMDGSVIRFNNGEKVNNSEPLYAVPYWLVQPPAPSHPEPAELPRDYIDPEHSGLDRQMLETFYLACRAEGGTADEIHLRGLKAVLAEAALAQPAPVGPTDEET
jgi:hypothetical protein